MSQDVWQQPEIITWSQLLLDSYHRLLGKQLIARIGNAEEDAKILFFAPMVVVSHGKEANPIFNYGNQTALTLWEMTWQEFIQTPSRNTVNPIELEELATREKLLQKAQEQGFMDNIKGIRISKTGKRFLIENVIVWNVIDSNNKTWGQAATYPNWTFL